MSMTGQIKLPPNDPGAESAVLGGLMVTNQAFPEASEILTAEDFYREDHRIIWDAIARLCAAGKNADLVTVTNALRESKQLEDAGGFAYIVGLPVDVPSATVGAIRHYAEIVRKKSILRQIITIGGDAADLGFNSGDMPVEQILDQVERGVFSIRQRGQRASSGAVEMAQLVEIAERGVEIRMQSGGGITGLRTGLVDLDNLTTGLHPGDLVILAGRPAMGKTSLAMNIAECCALDQDKWALVFSMEMPAEQLALRTMASRGRIPMQELRGGRMSQESMDRMTGAGAELRRAKMMVDETPALSPNELRARARRASMRHPLGLIVVDYIQLMQVPGTKENRTNEVSEISRNLKALAKELGIPVIALSQLNRGVEARENKRPRMSDLRESGGIEQDADLIVFVYRDEVYNKDSAEAGTAEIIIGKQRNGPLGTVRAVFHGEHTRFDNLAHDWRPAERRVVEMPKRRGFRGMSQAAHAIGADE